MSRLFVHVLDSGVSEDTTLMLKAESERAVLKCYAFPVMAKIVMQIKQVTLRYNSRLEVILSS